MPQVQVSVWKSQAKKHSHFRYICVYLWVMETFLCFNFNMSSRHLWNDVAAVTLGYGSYGKHRANPHVGNQTCVKQLNEAIQGKKY